MMPEPAARDSAAPPPAEAVTSVVAPPTAVSRAEKLLARQAQIEAEFANVKEAGFLYAALLLPVLVGTGWAYHTGNEDITALDLVISIVFYGSIAAFAWQWWPDLAPLLARPQIIDRTAVLVMASAPLISLTGVLVQESLLGPYLEAPDFIGPFLDAGWPGGTLYLWLAVLPAVFEEIAFRGLMLTRLGRVMSPAHAIWVTAILFGIIHFAILSLAFFLVPIALMAGWLTWRTKSLWPAIGVHFVHNAAVVTFELLA